MRETTDRNDGDTAGPDWAQFALVILSVLVLAVAAVAVPTLGGVGPGSGAYGVGDGGDADGELPDDGPADGQPAAGNDSDLGDQNGVGEPTDGEPGAGEPGDGDGDPSDPSDGDGSGEGGADGGDGTVGDGDVGGEGDDGNGDSDDGSPSDGGDDGDGGIGGGDEGDGGDSGSEPGGGNESDPGDGDTRDGGGDETGDGDEDSSDGGDGSDGHDGGAGDEDSGAPGGGSGEGEETSDGDSGNEGDGEDGGDRGGGEGESGDGSDEEDRADDGDEGDTGEDRADDGDGDDADGNGDDGPAYDVSFDEPPSPGAAVTATVTEDGEPLEGAAVAFDGEPIGTTDGDGTVTGTVPYTTSLEVTVDPSGASETASTGGGFGGASSDADAPLAAAPTAAPENETRTVVELHPEVALEIDGPVVPGLTATVSATVDGNPIPNASVLVDGDEVALTDEAGVASVTVPDVDGNVTVAVERGEIRAERTVDVADDPETHVEIDDPVLAGTDVTVSATVDGEPIADGTVLVNGDEVALTDGEGTASVAVPESGGNATVAVERGELRAERTVEIRALTVDVDAILPLPGRAVDVAVTDGVEPVENATVFVDGERVDTAENGTATVTLPMAGAATIGAAFGGADTETTVDGLYRNAALVLAGAVGLVAVVGWVLGRRIGLSVAALRSAAHAFVGRLRELLSTVGRRTVDGIVRLASLLDRLGDRLVDRSRSVALAIRRAGRWLAALPRRIREVGLAGVAAIHPRRLLRAVVAAVSSLLRSVRSRETAGERAGPGSTGTAGEEVDEAAARTLRELWIEFVRIVRPPRVRTKTPGEIGRYAVETGVPERPVRTVVETFRDAEYGDAAPSRDRLDRVRVAVRSVGDGTEAATAERGGASDTAVGDEGSDATDASDSDGGAQP